MLKPDNSRVVPADYFLYMLAEIEVCLDRIDKAWTQKQAGKIQSRLFHVATRVAQISKRREPH
jgi:hypothetical protein